MRHKVDRQRDLDFAPSNLKVTRDYFARYAAMDRLLEGTPEMLDLVHRDLEKALEGERKRDRRCSYTSAMVLRMVICQAIEGLSQRALVTRIDDSHYLRRFTGIGNGPMMNYATYCRLKNQIRPETWKSVHGVLARSAVEAERISGERLRLDTTAVETNIHYPTDSSLLDDTYRVHARLIRKAREIDPDAVGDRRLQDRAARRHATWIARKAGKRRTGSAAVRERYEALFGLVEAVLAWGCEAAAALRRGVEANAYDILGAAMAEVLAEDLEHYRGLGERVLDQARRRVLHGEVVPNEEKLYSIFEPHTELLVRGKAAKPVEFGHMILVQQVEGGFITDYDVFERRPQEPDLLPTALDRHEELFGARPREASTDKGFWPGSDRYDELCERVEIVSIGKKGRRTEMETSRETSENFKAAQRFRAGIEGAISFLKRVFGLARCFNKGWKHFQATVGAAIFAHNLWVLARGAG